MSAGCAFCEEHQSGIAPAFIRARIGAPSRVLCESENFYAVPSLSPLAAGHIMIITKRHYKSIAQCNAAVLPEFVSLICQVKEMLERAFLAPPLLFEHGVGREEKGGCGINHAHFHMVPMSKEHQEQVINAVAGEYELGDVSALDAKLLRIPPSHSYLLVGSSLEEIYAVHPVNAPSQYLRKIISEVTGSNFWDWRELFGWDDFENTFNQLGVLTSLT